MTPLGGLRPGAESRHRQEITAADIDAFARLSGDDNPIHLHDESARRQGFRGRIAHGMLLGALLSRVLGTALPGPGVVWLSQTTRFIAPAYVGDHVEVVVRVTHRSRATRVVVLQTTIHNDRQETLMTGEAKMMTPAAGPPVPWERMTAVVTGAGRGIGAAVARGLGERGARVVVNYLRDAAAAEGVVADIETAGGRAVAVQADMASQEGPGTLAQAALDAFGAVDVLVNNATPAIERRPLEELSWSDVDRYWNTYARSAFLLAEAVLPGMKERGFGRFVHVLTTAMWGTPPPNLAGYVAAKSGLWGLARAMAVEVAPFGITVNAVSPSAVITDQWREESEARRRALALGVPAQRLASAQEVAATVLFLVGPEGGYLTGANLPVAGGEVM